MKTFQQTQLVFTRHLRSPDTYPAPEGIESRRMAIYRDLIYNNIEGFIASAFPVLRSLLSDDNWHSLVRDFIKNHSCQTPYFLEISQEFLQYLMHERASENDLPFMLELAHYEWVELALDIADAVISPATTFPANPYNKVARVSPLVFCLEYQYPVHKISPAFQPEVGQKTYLIVYRNRYDDVKFMSANAMTLRLIYLLQNGDNRLDAVFVQIAAELQHPDIHQLKTEGLMLVKKLFGLSIISHFE